jgi:hypothetical protein
VSSTTIRYSGVPENSHSRGSGSESESAAESSASSTDLTVRWRSRLREAPNAARDTDPASRTGTAFKAGFTPGKAGPVSTDPRHNRAYPHPQNPGLFEEVDGFYDWAGRRLFLSDGSPDPMTPGAYRYQTRPDLCDLDASDSDPSNPRYEPDHLRHKPGDDWLIDHDRPYDVLDPGPFGSPGWFPDRRTGRHRRDELPDPIPWWEIEEDPEKAAWAEHAEALYDRRTRITREREAREAAAAAAARETLERAAVREAEQAAARDIDAEAARGRRDRPEHADRPDRSERSDDSDRSGGGSGGSGSGSMHRWVSGSEPWSARGREEAEPVREQGRDDHGRRRSPLPRRDVGWSQADRNSEDPPEPGRPGPFAERPAGDADRFAVSAEAPRRSDESRQSAAGLDRSGGPASRTASAGAADAFPAEAPHRFDKLREDAWDRFLVKSAELAAAHRTSRTVQTAIERECGPTIGRLARLIRIAAGAFKHRQARQGDPRSAHTAASAAAGDRAPTGVPGPAGPPVAGSIPRPREAASRSREVPRPREAAARTAVALRTSRFAQAIRGAERARAEIDARRSAAARTTGGGEAGIAAETPFGGAAWA